MLVLNSNTVGPRLTATPLLHIFFLVLLNLSVWRLSGNDLYRGENPAVAGDLGLFQSYRRSLLECSALPGKDQKLSLRRKAVIHTGNEH